jgi:hypothetical protein
MGIAIAAAAVHTTIAVIAECPVSQFLTRDSRWNGNQSEQER